LSGRSLGRRIVRVAMDKNIPVIWRASDIVVDFGKVSLGNLYTGL
jgi:hypothetical protein